MIKNGKEDKYIFAPIFFVVSEKNDVCWSPYEFGKTPDYLFLCVQNLFGILTVSQKVGIY